MPSQTQISNGNQKSGRSIGAEKDPFVLVESVFRDYDIRGIAFDEITPEFARRLGCALGQLILARDVNTLFVARDGRLSSDALSEALCLGLVSSGCQVVDLGVTTTPVLNFAIHNEGSGCSGVMVTASHNPGIYNGFKIILERQIISKRCLDNLKVNIEANNFEKKANGSLRHINADMRYLEFIANKSQIKRSFKIVIDGGNSVSGPLAVTLFQQLNCSVEAIFCDINGHFPHHEPNPSDEKNLTSLIAKVKQSKADLGLAFDGDGDRVVVISDTGEIIWPDRLMMIFVNALLVNKPGARVVFDIKSSMRLEQLIMDRGGIPIQSKTGHSHIRRAVHESDALIGGEFSGHIFFNDRWQGFDDGIYAAVRLMEILCESNTQAITHLSDLVSGFRPTSYTPEILIPIAETDKFALMQDLIANAEFADATINTLDGLRVNFEHGWGLIRASNTTPNLTLRFEAENDYCLHSIQQQFCKELRPFINNLEDYL
ncbi:MAG: phosphomannomutase/phosphoglucomutase [Porticoccaceae bacterium]|nr:phosphomannomutase/phosphoglucomutase [Porticoccaceae bacterium]MDG1474712.1 phosphomannomutase/phosphoglucomutase [Porticoccaceae bacterium]